MMNTKISFRRNVTPIADVPKNPSTTVITEPVSTIKILPIPLQTTIPLKQTIFSKKINEGPRFATPGIVKRPTTEQTQIKDTSKPLPKIKIGKDKKIEAVEEVKKKGRPSKEEIARREQEKLDKENELKEKLLQKDSSVIAEIIQKENIIIDPSIPIFKVGEYVKDKILNGRKVFKGIVSRQDIDAPRYVFVAWKDGSKQWHGAVSLERITRDEYKRKSTPDEVVAEEIDAKEKEAKEEETVNEQST